MLSKIIVNGKERDMDPGLTVTEFLLQGKIRPELVTVEVNGSILQKLDYDETEIKAGDRVEFIFYMGGGNKGENA